MAVGALPPARLVAVRRAPRRLPRARPVRGCARGFCGVRARVRPSGGPARKRAVPPPGFGPRPGPWARSAPLRRACAPASVGLGLSARSRARRSGPRCPPAAPAVAGRAPPPPVRPAPGGRGGPLSAPGSPWFFRLAWPAGSPRAARRLRRRLRPRSSRAGARGSAPLPAPARCAAIRRSPRKRSRLSAARDLRGDLLLPASLAAPLPLLELAI